MDNAQDDSQNDASGNEHPHAYENVQVVRDDIESTNDDNNDTPRAGNSNDVESNRGRNASDKIEDNIESGQSVTEAEEMKRKLEFHFSDCLTKACKRNVCCIPFKFVVSVLKIVFVVWQLAIFGEDRAGFATYLSRTNSALRHSLLKEWSSGLETMPYPPSSGPYAVYSVKDLHEHIRYAVDQVYNLPSSSVGSFFVEEDRNPVKVCVEHYNKGIFNATEKKVFLSLHKTSECYYVDRNSTNNLDFKPSLEDLLRSDGGVLVRLYAVNIYFAVQSVYIRRAGGVQCFNINGKVLFDNGVINGQILVKLTTDINEFDCDGESDPEEESTQAVRYTLYVTVLSLSTASIVLHSCSLYRSISLAMEAEQKLALETSDRWQIIRFYPILVITGDVANLIGTCLKIYLDHKDSLDFTRRERTYHAAGVLIGFGCMLVWLEILSYFSFKEYFYLLFAVIERCLWTVFQFSVCLAVLFAGFTLFGWLVLSPYNIKFLSLASTYQCLMGLLTGDEVYVTFTAVEESESAAHAFNIVFLTIFISIFTIIALTILIAIINTTYEEVQKKEPKGKLQKEIMGRRQLAKFPDKGEIKKSCKENFRKYCCKCRNGIESPE